MDAALTPMWRNSTPASASSGTIPRVCPGTSVILAAIVRLPNRASSRWDRLSPNRNRDASMFSLNRLNGRACQATSPASIAASIRLRPARSARSRYSWISHEPVVQMNPVDGWSVERPAFLGPAARICSLREIALGMNSSMYLATMVDAKSLNPMSRWVLNTTWTRSTASLTTRLLIGGEKRRADPPPFRPSLTCRRSADPIVLTYPTSALGAIRCRSGRPYATVWEATLGRGLGRPGRRCDRIVSDRNPALVRRTVFKPSIAKRTVSRQGP